MSSLEEIRNERIKKLLRLKDLGVDAYPAETSATHSIVEAIEQFETLSNSASVVTVAGRVRGIRAHGGAIFFDLADGSYNGSPENPVPNTESFELKLQGYIKRDSIGEDSFLLFEETIDVGDFVEITGKLFLTKRQEKTIDGSAWKILTKSLRPLPDKWHGLQDVEERFRKRYLDSLMSGEVRRRFVIRSRVIQTIRQYLDELGYLEVETPVLQPLYGGASAKPFTTRHEALGTDLYLRISDELYLKRMLVGGFPKVYEIGRDFRNEGIDVTHNPEFTMLEFYESFSTAGRQQELTEKLIQTLAQRVLGVTELSYEGSTIDLSKKFTRITYSDLLKRYALIPNPEKITLEEAALRASQLGIPVAPSDSREKILDNIYKKACRPKLIQPTFVTDYPVDYLPLAKRTPGNPDTVDAFQLIIGGIELVKAFSELNDPIDQQDRFTTQEKQRKAGDTEAQAYDADFIESLEYGMPPAGGVGIGIDRLVMLLTDTHNIKEVIYFPTMKPEASE